MSLPMPALIFMNSFLMDQTAWVARKISVQFAESEWIAKALVAMFITAFTALPVLVIAYHNPQVFYFIRASLIFITCASLLGCMFIPKELYRTKKVKLPSNTFDSTHFGRDSTYSGRDTKHFGKTLSLLEGSVIPPQPRWLFICH